MFRELSVGHDRERGVYLDPLNMASITSEKQRPRQITDRSYYISYKYRSIKSIDYRQASPHVTNPNTEMHNPVYRTVLNGLSEDQVGV
jgi:hypothetical protein